MEVTQHSNYVLIKLAKNTKIDTLIDFLETCGPSNSLIINFLNSNIADHLIVSKLLPFHFIWTKHNQSFILISTIRKKFLKELVSLPSLEEAVDFFHMDQLTRNI